MKILSALGMLAVSLLAAASDTGPRPAPRSPAPVPTDDARRRATSDRLAVLLAPEGLVVDAGIRAREAPTFRQVRVHWRAKDGARPAGSAGEAVGTLTAEQVAPAPGDLPRRRSLDLAETELLIVALDGMSRVLWWTVMADPRLLRAETVDDSGELSGGLSYLPTVDFPIAYPDDPAIEALRLYHPRWTGSGFRLVPLAVLGAGGGGGPR
jgi:hypothetical protein